MTSSRPKYSIVIPTLNGARTLAVTLPYMLKVDRDDVEWVISDNCSDDDTAEVVARLHDRRITLVRAPRRLAIGDSLDFAYSHARGLWQGHLGDDDVLIPSRFGLLDEVLRHSEASVSCGGHARYYWPDYRDLRYANTLDPSHFTNHVTTLDGEQLARRMINCGPVMGGGSWVVHKEVIDKVRSRCGYFSSRQHVEFFAMRAACAVAKRVTIIDTPIYIMGRHEKSAATQGLYRRSDVQARWWSWSLEDPNQWRFCPFQYKGYYSISLDAALATRAVFRDELGDVAVNWLYWMPHILRDMKNLVNNEQLSAAELHLFSEGLACLPWRYRVLGELGVVSGIVRCAWLMRCYRFGRAAAGRWLRRDGLGWAKRVRGGECGIANIGDVGAWVDMRLSGKDVLGAVAGEEPLA